MSRKKRILIIDGYNQFLRSYIVDPSLGTNGAPMGGCKGFLKSLQKMVREIKYIDEIIVCWDGEGGSRKRRRLHKGYKEGRKPIQLNRNIVQNLSPEQEAENQRFQQLRLCEYLNHMPVVQFVFKDVEADDVIARIVKLGAYKGKIKIIVSSDKDFYQLCDEETVVFRPIQKQALNVNKLVDQFGIHPNNFALARSICGDASDNIEGIHRAGLTTVAKRFPFLAESKVYTLDDLFKFCTGVEKKIKLYENILENKKLLRRNLKLTSLDSPKISARQSQNIRTTIENFSPEFNKMDVIRMMASDGFTDWKWDSLFRCYRTILFANRQAQS